MNLKSKAHAILRRTGLGIFKTLLDDDQIEDVVTQWYPQMRRRALTVGSLLGLLTVAQLEEGIDAVDELLRRGWGRVREAYGLGHTERPVTHQAFSWRLKTLPWQIFRGILGVLFASYSEMVHPGQGLYHGVYSIQAIDGTVVDVAARLIRSWADAPGRGGGPSQNAQAKLHTMFNVSLRVPTLVTVTGAQTSELKYARKMVRGALKRGLTILVFDLGYFAFRFFDEIKNAGGFFVARLKGRTRYQILRTFGRQRNGVSGLISRKGGPMVQESRRGPPPTATFILKGDAITGEIQVGSPRSTAQTILPPRDPAQAAVSWRDACRSGLEPWLDG